uniref:No apical meristem-associated C-terminal domain-containing protein n=1 Tax=Brassica oleracea var. oleracea TaxID=109376 RepID=A0A0D3AVC3_BRAOL
MRFLKEGSKPTTKDDDSLGPHGVSSVFSRLLRQKKDPIPPHTTTFCPDSVISVASRLLQQKNDANPPWTMSVSVLTASPPSCLVFSKNDANPPQTTSVSVLTASPPTSVSVLTEITSQGLLSSYGLLCLTLFELSTGKHFFRLSDLDSTNPYTLPSNFFDLLYSQQDCVPFPYENFSHGGDLGSSQLPVFSTQATELQASDPVVGNEQKAGAFWKRIAGYIAASPKVERGGAREAIQCKKRWQKMNDLVCKFCGAYTAATKQKTSGQSGSDVVKMGHEIFYNNHKIKFNLHYAWEALKNNQKWCALTSSKIDGPQSSSAKKRRCEDGQEASSQATTNGDHPTKRPPGVKAAKGAGGKRTVVDQLGVSDFHGMWSIKEKDLAAKERL